jgi:hypothetical protein
VVKSVAGSDLFLNIKVKPAADLSKLEEVLVITKMEDKAPALSENGNMRAVDILAQRLPSVPDKPAEDVNKTTTLGTGAAATKPEAAPGKPNTATVLSQQSANGIKPVPGSGPSSVKPAGIALVKPAGETKAAPPIVKASDGASGEASPAVVKAKPKSQTPPAPSQTNPAQPPPVEDKPQ